MVSIISSISSIILAIFAILFSMRVEKRLKNNFLKLKDVMDNNHERTKEVLANMDSEAAEIKTLVHESQIELKKEFINIMDDNGIPMQKDEKSE